MKDLYNSIDNEEITEANDRDKERETDRQIERYFTSAASKESVSFYLYSLYYKRERDRERER